MRRFILLVLVLVTTIACKKGKPVAESERIIGKWNLVLTTGGIAGIHQTPAQSGHTKSLTFRTDNTYTAVIDGSTANNSYYVKDEYSADYQKNVWMLYLNGTDKYIVNYVHDTLTIDMNAVVDGTTDWFVRQ